MKTRQVILLSAALFGIGQGHTCAADVDNWLERTPPPQRETATYRVTGEARTRYNTVTTEQSFVLETSWLRDGEKMSTRTIRWDDRVPKLGWCSYIDKWYIAYEMPPTGARPQRCFYAADGLARIGDMVPTGLGIFDGHLPDETISLQEIVRSSDKREISSDLVDGHGCLKLAVDHSAYGHYVLWLDPQADYSLRKLLVSKVGKHIWRGHKLEDWLHMSPRGSKGKVHLKSMTLTVDDVILDQASGRWDAAAWSSTVVQEYSDGNGEQVVQHGRRVEIHLGGASLDRDFMPGIAKGMLLTNLNDAQLPFEWTGSGPKPWVDRPLVASMDSAANVLRSAIDLSQNQK